ncbi:hypothetical protein CH337_12410 [Rhodoblastus acidophilus]|nr:hypothetical protein CKO16_00475 [Rhodoblastus acidophilus]RAI19372.1 hypothetical protein CH337_12410 [Rhodoblastus acidophilus]
MLTTISRYKEAEKAERARRMKEPGRDSAEFARRAAEAQCRRGFEALPAHVAVLDETGAIMLVNRAWTDFARDNGAGSRAFGVAVGVNYLDVCRRASGADATARQALVGLEAVLCGAVAHFEMEYPCDAPNERRWFLMTADALDPQLPMGAIVSHLDISGRKLAELALAESEQRYRAVFDGAAVGMAELAADGRWQRANAALLRIVGRSAEELLANAPLGALTHPDDIDAASACLEMLRAGVVDRCTMETRLVRSDGVAVWTETALSCLRADDGALAGLIAVIADISDRKRAEERQWAMMRELEHRGKNLLAVVQSIAQRSLADGRSLAEARAAFLGRLQALAATYGALIDEGFGGARLDRLVNTALAAFPHAEVEGPSFVLTVKAAQTFGLIVHELTTNAAKFGALSRPDGALRVTWDVRKTAEGAKFAFDWRERYESPAPPGETGFGATILSRIAAAEFACEPELVHAPDGFHYRFEAPLDRLGGLVPVAPLRRALASEALGAFYDQWARLRGPRGELPQLSQFDWSRFVAVGALTLASVQPKGGLSLAQIGRAAPPELQGEDPTAFRCCAEDAAPRHDRLRFDFGDGAPLGAERLLLPFSATGAAATHVLGLSILGLSILGGGDRLPESERGGSRR